MKTIFTLILAALISFTAKAQYFSLQTVALGTNAIPANGTLTLPLTLSTYTVTNIGIGAYFYLATNSATNIVKFTLPVTNTLSFTNTFIESNSVVGISTKSWTVNEPFSVTNTVASTNITGAYYTYSNGVVTATNAAVTNLVYQTYNMLTPVPFSITGTNSSTVNYTNFGSSAIGALQSSTIGVKVGFRLVSSGTSVVVFNYIPNLDGIIDTNNPVQSFSLVANGTGSVSTNVSITAGPFGFLNFTSITNGNSAAVTNLFIKIAQKVSSP